MHRLIALANRDGAPARTAALIERLFAAYFLEGRDIGTVVFPDAGAKFFLTASVEVRAERRYQEHVARGDAIDRELILQEVAERDARDTQRPVAPLRQAKDAVLVDSSSMTIDEVVAFIVDKVRALKAAAAQAHS